MDILLNHTFETPSIFKLHYSKIDTEEELNNFLGLFVSEKKNTFISFTWSMDDKRHLS